MIKKIKTFCSNFLSKRANVILLSYCTALVFSSVAFGLLFAKLIGGRSELEQGNSFTHAFSVGTYHVLIMVAVLLVIACFTWSLVNTILLLIPATKKIMLEDSKVVKENRKLFLSIHICSFSLLGLFTCLVFFLSRIIIMEKVDNGILPAAGFLGVFSLLAFVFTCFANCILNYGLFIKEDKKEEVKVVNKPIVKEEKKVEVKVEKVEKKEEVEEKAIPLKEILKTAAVKKAVPVKPKEEKPKKGEVVKEEKPKEIFNKKLLGEVVKENYPKLVHESRGNYTSTGLPLADTFYINTVKGKKCFMYSYETEGSSLILCKISSEYYKKLKGNKDLTVNRSQFPKSKVTWSSLVLDENVDRELVKDVIKEASEFVDHEAATDPTIMETKKVTKTSTKGKKTTRK